MFFVLKPEVDAGARDRFLEELRAKDLTPLAVSGEGSRVYGLVGPSSVFESLALDRHPLIEEVIRDSAPYKRASRAMHPDDTVVSVGSIRVGGERFVVIAGPCAVESEAQLEAAAAAVKAAGAAGPRGGAHKPRPRPAREDDRRDCAHE